jgi:hypothetical protein
MTGDGAAVAQNLRAKISAKAWAVCSDFVAHQERERADGRVGQLLAKQRPGGPQEVNTHGCEKRAGEPTPAVPRRMV